MLPRIAFPFLISLSDAGPITSDIELKVDCSKYNEHKELIRGPRPDYDQYGADSPPELSEDQKKICEDEWNLEQYREWVNNNANRIQVKEEDCQNVKKVTDRGPRPDFTEFEEPSTDSQELQAADLNDHLVEIYCEEFQDILLLSSSTSTTEYSTETLLDTTISTSATESTSTTTTTTTTTSTTTETVAENLFDPIIYQSESQSFSNAEICEYNSKACCPLFVQSNNPIWSQYGSWENIFDTETVTSLEDSRLKKMCHKENFSPCCVTPQLCQLQSQYGTEDSLLPHCDEDFGAIPSKFGDGEGEDSEGSEDSSEDSSDDSSGSEDYEGAGMANREGNPEGTAAPIIEDPRSEEEINATKEGAFYGIVVIICLLALIVLLIIGTFIGKKCSPGAGGYTEGNSLIAGNVEDQEIEDEEQVQQQQVQN